MPELPDIEAFRRYFDSTALHQKIQKTKVGDVRILEGVSPRKLHRALNGQSFQSTWRHGKLLFVELANRAWLVLHFGMTGQLKYFRSAEQQPSHTRLLVQFTNGFQLAYECQRMLGAISLTQAPDHFIRRKRLGPDALELDRARFRQLFWRRRGRIKPALMNQHTIAGLGNIYTDEVLFQAGIHPTMPVRRLNDAQLSRLFSGIRRVLSTSIRHGSDARDLPASYLIHHRSEGDSCPRCGAAIRRTRLNQRGTYFCGRCQRL